MSDPEILELVELDPEAMEKERAFWKELQDHADRMLAKCAIPKEMWDAMLQESPNRMTALASLELFRRKVRNWKLLW